MAHVRSRIVVLIAAVGLAWSSMISLRSASAPPPAPADRLVDSVGVNIHLHYNKTAYRDHFPLIKRRLLELGVRHVRDGLIDTTWRPYFDRHNELGEAGIKGTFITSPEQSVQLWADYPTRMQSTFEAFEAPNEYDLKGRRPDWATVLRDTVKRLHTLKDVSAVAHFPIYGPSLTSKRAYAELGDVSAYYDFANLHNYYGGRHPSTRGWGRNGHGSIAWHFRLTEQYARAKPVVTTETGYQDHPSQENWIPQDVAGRYMPIVILEQFRAGIVRTFLYELIDFPKSGSYGLLNEDGSPKPAFTAVEGLLDLLDDPGPRFTLRDLPYTIRNDKGELRHLAFQKRDGTSFVALWQTKPSYNQRTGKRVTVPPQDVVITVPPDIGQVRTHEWQLDGSVSTSPWSKATAMRPVPVADRLVAVEMARTLTTKDQP
jgi:hypothetical protein